MIEMRPIQEHQTEQAKQIVKTVVLEVFQYLLTEGSLDRHDPMLDIEQVRQHYFDNFGIFLVLMDNDQIVGTGAIRKLDDLLCELKRMWFLNAYRGQGWGWQMAQKLFSFARQVGYQKVRLDLAHEERQMQALKFYRQLGFYPIARYNNSLCRIFMEKLLV